MPQPPDSEDNTDAELPCLSEQLHALLEDFEEDVPPEETVAWAKTLIEQMDDQIERCNAYLLLALKTNNPNYLKVVETSLGLTEADDLDAGEIAMIEGCRQEVVAGWVSFGELEPAMRAWEKIEFKENRRISAYEAFIMSDNPGWLSLAAASVEPPASTERTASLQLYTERVHGALADTPLVRRAVESKRKVHFHLDADDNDPGLAA